MLSCILPNLAYGYLYVCLMDNLIRVINDESTHLAYLALVAVGEHIASNHGERGALSGHRLRTTHFSRQRQEQTNKRFADRSVCNVRAIRSATNKMQAGTCVSRVCPNFSFREARRSLPHLVGGYLEAEHISVFSGIQAIAE